jgi:hypothetical protein
MEKEATEKKANEKQFKEWMAGEMRPKRKSSQSKRLKEEDQG